MTFDEPVVQAPARTVDAEVLERQRQGFLALLEKEQHQVARFVMFNGASKEDAMDAAQAAFTQAWALICRRPEWWDTVRDPRAWVRTVALRCYRRPPDRRREPPTVLGDVPGERVWEGQDPGEFTAGTLLVLDALRRLPEDVRMAMAFRVDGFRPVDVAAELGITDQQARDLLKKGRRILRRELGLRVDGRPGPAQASAADGDMDGRRES
ncbi:hypothetical protein GCM10009677_15080 [Sphaerisporangium rubeum]|uniref:RNA polymerase sigma-70 factor (ECF subfamily) n=1 Tax=Sphaerisporangium rubeum TaxID=321317 RepID=A0A7X0ICW0_9ACTN|nr:sigma-70 family RNA polymerase sigma factor [Sphaerisporangium rubeum]MBB6472179.1 RNA polymerase sigma-70 factor (ECF subfamily) [Sphaerisporangium rubeum]